MAIDGFRVSGACLISTGTGAAGALETLGYTQDGAEWEINPQLEPLFTDIFGPRTPHTMQDLGLVGRITLPLIAVDSTIVAKIESKGDRTTLGELNTPGSLLTSVAFRVVLAAPLTPDCVRSFNLCLVESIRGKNATKANPMVMTLVAGPFQTYSVTTAKDVPIWTKSAS